MNLMKKTTNEFSEPPPVEFWMSLLLQLMDGKPDLSNINPNVIEFLQAVINSYEKINQDDEEMAECFYYFADVIMNSANNNKRNFH